MSSAVFEQLMRIRGFNRSFLQPKYEDCFDPLRLPDMEKAVGRIRRAVQRREKVLIYGDYDVDGVTASTVMYDALRLAGVEVIGVMLPNRFTDGYGMSEWLVERAKKEGVNLVVTVDCGSRNHEIIAELKANGIDTIVTDHHECAEGEKGLPEAVAVVNPKRKDCCARGAIQKSADTGKDTQGLAGAESGMWETGAGSEMRELAGTESEMRELAGVGVAFKLAQALVKAGMIPEGQEKWLLDLVLIGTICDSMELTGENRRLCYYGLKVLEKTRRVGLKELLQIAGVKNLNGEAIGFQIGPRLNAAGRMETAEKALALLMARRRTEAAELATVLNELNRERRTQQQTAVKEIRERGVGEEAVIVAKGEWHEGILGIIAGKLVEEYQRPAFVLTEVQGCLKGSGRSFGEFNLAEALQATEKWVLGGGGHAAACGVKLPLGGLEAFRETINAYYAGLGLKNQERFLGVREDLAVKELGDLSLELMAELRNLEPFGSGNAEPVFLLPEMEVLEMARLGAEGKHLRLTVRDERGSRMKLMSFYAPDEYFRLGNGGRVNAWVTLNENEFRGTRSVEGRIVKLAKG